MSCEEALYLLDSGALTLTGGTDGSPVAFTTAYATLIAHVDPDEYRVFAELRAAGYVAIRVSSANGDVDMGPAADGRAKDIRVQFEVYAPRTYRKREPGVPLFCVAVVKYVTRAA